MKYKIGELELDVDNFTLLKEGSPLADATRSARLLAVLRESYPEICSHKTLLQRLWPDTVVSQWSLSRLVSDTRKLFRENGYDEPLIQTLAGQGYRLAPELSDYLRGVDIETDAENARDAKPEIMPDGELENVTIESQPPHFVPLLQPDVSPPARSQFSTALFSLVALVTCVLMVTLLVHLLRPPEIGAQVKTLKQANIQIQVDGGDEFINKSQSLPYLWDSHHKGQTGTAEFNLQFDYPLASSDEVETASVYIPRVGNRYQIIINGSVLATAGHLNTINEEDYGMQPTIYPLPSALLRAQDNHLQIRVRADRGRRGGLSSVFVGPHSQVQPLYDYDYRWIVPGTIFSVVFSALIALGGLVLWFLQVRVGGYRRDGDVLYAYLIIAELAWVVRAGSVLMTEAPIPWPWGGIVVVVAMAIWSPALWYFYAEVGQWQRSRAWAITRQWLFVLIATSPLVGWLALVKGLPEVLTWWYMLGMATFGLMLLANVRYIFTGTLVQRILVATLLVNVVVASYDLYNFRITTSEMGTITLMRYSVLLFGLAFLVVLILRFRAIVQSFRTPRNFSGPIATPVGQNTARTL